MSIKVYDFKCSECCNTFERFVDDTKKKIDCPDCEGEAIRLISMPLFKLDGTDPNFPTAWDKWAKDRKRRLAQEAKGERE